ncbi:NADH peroxidase [Clostridium tepidiprofundi DSM 19306]|uniref:NADH peroxidase n=1 Tax=Clostridium tepidiprofundi DSM 19306 TaxID=1121338 RepID=A0A151B255_9CLOT|nr:FAD-dependent oxidoreductase [Clostridium tepidiprofundi]KYH33995.1 NADH peroxidase [Clostridium tepidiprofundi DSM 19306]
MKKTDVLVIGGSAAGFVTAATAKSNYPEKDVTIIRKEEIVMIPCGIPYVYGTSGSTDKNVLPDAGLNKLGVNIVIDEVVSVDKDSKKVKTKKGEEFEYDKLVFATGSTPAVPKWLKGTELENVFTIPKNKVYLDELMVKLKDCKKVVTVGAGFIGIEMSDELNKIGKEVTVVEMLPHILGLAFDEELAVEAEEILTSRGVKLVTGVGVKEILGDAKVKGVMLNNGDIIDADAVVLSMGYRPNVKLAEDTGVAINERGFIVADQFRRTNIEDIFAVGDCSEKRDFITGKLSGIMLASTACAEARVAGMNLYGLSSVKTFPGTIGIYSTAIGETAFGAAGLTEKQAENKGFEVVTGSFTGMDRHPGNFEDAHKQMVKLIVSKDSGIILGGEVIGGKTAGELINVIGFIIQNRMTIADLLVAQIGTQPMLTASPAAYPLIKAAEMAAKKLK